jgi:hypothetical protein
MLARRSPRQRWSSRARLQLLAVALLAFALHALADDYRWDRVERIVAIGDVHGDYDNYIEALRSAGLIDGRGRWSGGETHLVQLGDVPDRGPETHRIIEHLQRLERQASKAGGRVHTLIGNHEAMNVIGDLRYVHPGEYAALATRRSGALLEDYYQRVLAYRREQDPAYEPTEADRDAWFAEHPPGFIEHRQHWHPQGEFGSWVLGHPAMIRINDTLFVHGGLGATWHDLSLEEINERVRRELSDVRAAEPPLFIEDPDGPLWHRGFTYGQGPEGSADAAELEALLERFGAKRIVVGHTPGFGTVMPRYDGRVLLADTGISKAYGGFVATVLIEDGAAFTRQGGETIPIPDSDEDLLAYLERIAGLQSTPTKNIELVIEQLRARGPAALYPAPQEEETTEAVER